MTVRMLVGDCREMLAQIPDASVQLVVTSPPYFGLRDYGTASWEGGDVACDHMEVQAQNRDGRETPGGRGGTFPTTERAYKSVCSKCGARRIDQQIGLESTVEAYVDELVAVFREVRRVLRDDGVLFLNLGDSYAGGGGGNYGGSSKSTATHGDHLTNVRNRDGWLSGNGLKPKDLIGVPWRVAFALQADGWYLRSDIIWAKPNPMPESVRDRPTKAHEMIFLLTKSPRYFWDAEAVREGIGESTVVVAADLQDERLVLGQNLGPEEAAAQRAHIPVSPLHHDRHILQVSIRLAATILDCTQREDEFSLSALDAEIGQEGAGDGASAGAVGVPVMRRATAQATRFADGDISPKEFLREMDRLCVALPDGDDLKELCVVAGLAGAAPVELINANGDRAISVNDASKVGQLQLIHNEKYTSKTTHSSEKRIKTKVPGGWDTGEGSHGTIHRTGRTEAEYVETELRGGRNIRSVWTIPTFPLPMAHFATFPPALAERCIKAGTSEKGACGACGAPWVRVVERETRYEGYADGRAVADDGKWSREDRAKGRTSGNIGIKAGPVVDARTAGWQPTCACWYECESCNITCHISQLTSGCPKCGETMTPAPGLPIPCVVLDPFGGAGTVSLVAERLGRDSIYIDLSAEYAAMAEKRIRSDAPMFARIT